MQGHCLSWMDRVYIDTWEAAPATVATESFFLPSLLMSSPQDRGSVLDSSSSDSPTLSDCRNESIAPLPRRPIPRKGHTKSRRGCYSCKRRRIKCNERHPECSHCLKAGLQCEYPANIIQATQRSHAISGPRETGNFRPAPGVFVSTSLSLELV